MDQGGIELADVEAALKGRRQHLRFTPKIEAAFGEHTRLYRAKVARSTILPSILTYNVFLAVDFLLVPETFWLSAALHLGIVTPLLVLAGLVVGRWPGLILREAFAAGIPLLMAAQILFIHALNQSDASDQYQYLAVMILVYMNVNQRPDFRFAVGASSLLSGCYMTVLLSGSSSASVKLVGVTLMAAAAYLTLTANRRMERDARYGFLKGLEDQLRRGKAEAEANRDALTGLFNRRHLDDSATRIWTYAAAADPSASAAVIMIDVDHFKSFNDLYGHPVGDLCLKRVASAISTELLNGRDLAVRYGGEEFLVLLPHIDLADALQTAERIRRAVEDAAIPHPVLTGSGVVTVSLGVMAGSMAVHSPSELTTGADAALYAAKRKGRNQVWPPFLAVDTPIVSLFAGAASVGTV